MNINEMIYREAKKATQGDRSIEQAPVRAFLADASIQADVAHFEVVSAPSERSAIATQPTRIVEIINAMLANLSASKNIRQFSKLANLDQTLKKELGVEAGSKEEMPQRLVDLGKKRGFEFTIDDVQKIPGTWETHSEKGVINAFLAYGKSGSGLETFLQLAKSDTTLLKKFNALVRNKRFAESLVNLGEELGHSFTQNEVNEALEGIDFSTSPDDNHGETKRRAIGRIWA